MARKKHLINVHTSTGTTAPTGASLYLGEIAVQHTPNDPGLWIKMGSSESSTEYEKFIGKTEITNLIQASNILGSAYTYSGISYVNSATTISDAYSALTKEMIDDEIVVASALNDLNARVDALCGATGDNTEILEYVQENEEAVAGALNNLNERLGTVETHMTGDYIPITGYMTASGSTEEELTLKEGDTVNEALGKLQKQMLDNEEAIAAGLNDLNTRLENVDELIAHNTGVTQLSGAVRSLSAATVAGLEELYDNVENNFYDKTTIRSFSSATQSLSSATQALSSATQTFAKATLTVNLNGVEQGKYTPWSGNTVIDLTAVTNGSDVLLTGYELATGTTEEELAIVATDTVNEAFGKIQKQNYDNEAVVAGALNDLDERITLLEVSGSSSDDLEELSGAVMSKEIVIAAALNDLNSRIVELSGNTGGAETDPIFSSSVAARITQQDIDKWDAAAGGGSSDPNAITGITMNGNAVSVSSRVAALGTVVTAQTQLSKGTTTGTGNVVTDINVSNHQITLVKSYSAAPADQFVTLSGAAHSKITALSAATTGINSTLTAHTGNGDIHVTSAQKTNWTNSGTSGANAYVGYIAHSANTGIHVTSTQKSTWDGKQDAISDLSTIRNNASSGASAYTGVTALSAATTAMSANVAKIAVTGVTITGTGNAITNATYGSSALSLTKGNVLTAETLTGVSLAGTAVTLSNKVAPIPSASSSAFGVVKTGNFIDNNNGTIAVLTGTTNTTVARGDQFLAVSAATTGNTSNLNTLSGAAHNKITNLSAATTAHTATTIANGTSSQMHLPTVSASENGMILQVKNGAWSLVTPVSIYTGSGTPAQNLGNDGDIYLQTS